jgi:murein DD-endopeptidase MepM/ murein hydrolase activator NlpD
MRTTNTVMRVLLCLWCGLAAADGITVPAPPGPVTIDGQDWLVYELHVTPGTSRIGKIEVSSGTAVLKTFQGDDLAQRISTEPGGRSIVYLEVPVTSERTLRHRVIFETDGVVVSPEIAILPRARLALGFPLRAGPWAAVYAWEWPRGHRRVFYTVDGKARLPGRLAIDFVRKDEQGRSANGDADIVRNSYGYGAEVLAVAHARVAAVRDDMSESERVSTNPTPATEDASGNYVALDLGDGRFAIYEHLKPRSIRVKAGDRVRRGQVIASLGFTGSSTEPHLHFHVADSPSPLGGEGLPFEFESHGKRERPAPNVLVTFE